MSLQINKKRKRALDYTYADQGRVLAFTFEKPSDKEYTKIGEMTREEAHRWFHGDDITGDPLYEKTKEEKMEAIRVAMTLSCEKMLDACEADDGWLNDLYQRARETEKYGSLIVRPVQR